MKRKHQKKKKEQRESVKIKNGRKEPRHEKRRTKTKQKQKTEQRKSVKIKTDEKKQDMTTEK